MSALTSFREEGYAPGGKKKSPASGAIEVLLGRFPETHFQNRLFCASSGSNHSRHRSVSCSVAESFRITPDAEFFYSTQNSGMQEKIFYTQFFDTN